jgi:hypothetical protein
MDEERDLHHRKQKQEQAKHSLLQNQNQSDYPGGSKSGADGCQSYLVDRHHAGSSSETNKTMIEK